MIDRAFILLGGVMVSCLVYILCDWIADILRSYDDER